MSTFTVSYASNMWHHGNFRSDLEYETQCVAIDKSRKIAHKKWVEAQKYAATRTLNSEVTALKMLVTESHYFQLKNKSSVLERTLRSRCTQENVAKEFEKEKNQQPLTKGGLSPLSLKELLTDVDVLYQALLKNSPPSSPVASPRGGNDDKNGRKKSSSSSPAEQQESELRFQKTNAYSSSIDVLKALPMWVCKQQTTRGTAQ